MASLVVKENLVIIACELQLLVLEQAETGSERRVALPSCQGESEGRAVSCLSVSPCGSLLAVCDDRKQVSVLSLPDFRHNRLQLSSQSLRAGQYKVLHYYYLH